VVQPRPERPPFQVLQAPGIPVPPHVSLKPEVPENDGWQEIFHLAVSQHHGWPNLSLPTTPPISLIVQAAPAHSPMWSSHARKMLKIEAHHALDKGKSIVSPSSPSNCFEKSVSSWMHLRDDFSHVISEIRPKGSAQPKENLATIKEILRLRVGNMDFEFLFYLLLMAVDFRSFWTTCFIFGYMSNIFLKIISNIMS
jgi:hypothetical protein